MGSSISKVDVESVHKMVIANPVVIFTKSQCHFCTKCKALLSEENMEYEDIDLDKLKENHPQPSNIINGLVYTTRTTSVPQIFICGKFIGGFTELKKMKESKTLWESVAECSGENSSHPI